jgi:hypothetical protein
MHGGVGGERREAAPYPDPFLQRSQDVDAQHEAGHERVWIAVASEKRVRGSLAASLELRRISTLRNFG